MSEIFENALEQATHNPNDSRKLKSFLGYDFPDRKTLMGRGKFLDAVLKKFQEYKELA